MSAAGHNALACATLLYENNRADGEAGVRASVGAQSELRVGPLLVRAPLFPMGMRGVRAGHREARRALDIDPLSAYVSMILAACFCYSRPTGRGDRDGPPGRSTGPRVIRGALGTRRLAGNGWTIRRGGLHARGCRRNVGAPHARPHLPGRSLRTVGEAGGGERAASRTDGQRLARLCPGCVPCPYG